MSDNGPDKVTAVEAAEQSTTTAPVAVDSAQVPKAASPSAPALSLKAEATDDRSVAASTTTTAATSSSTGNGINKDDLDSDEYDDEDEEYSDDDEGEDDGPGLSYLLQDVSLVSLFCTGLPDSAVVVFWSWTTFGY